MKESQPLSPDARLPIQVRAIGDPDTFSDDEPTSPDRSWPEDGAATFYRALLSMQARSNDLSGALQAACPLDMEIAASNLLAACLAATVALKTLRLRTANARARECAAAALNTYHEVLARLFHRCLASPSPVSKLPRLRDILDRLGSTIDQALNAADDPPA